MAIVNAFIHVICQEQEKRNLIRGRVLTLGQQAVLVSRPKVKNTLAKYRIHLNKLPDGFDTSSKIPFHKGSHLEKNMNVQSLFMTLGAESVYVADVSSYENPDFIIDLNQPVDPVHYNQFDVILDAGTLEHVFDVATAFDNINRMLRVGGNVVIFVPASNSIDHGFYSFSPTLFFDYFGDNGYSQATCYLLESSPFLYETKGRVFRYTYVGRERPLVSSKAVSVLFVATKQRSASSDGPIKPIQRVYRGDPYAEVGSEQSGKTASPLILKRAKRLVFRFVSFAGPFLPYFIQRLTFGKFANKGLQYVGTY